jgi:UPF0176 protein
VPDDAARVSGSCDALEVATGYLFAELDDARAVRDRLEDLARSRELLGTILVAPEGVNLTVHGRRAALDDLEARLQALPGLGALRLRRSDDFGIRPFRRLKVQLRREIVTLGRAGDPLEHRGGRAVPPERWHTQLDDPAVTVVDLRNDYEVAAGTFPGAVDPGTGGFREFPDWLAEHHPERDAPIAMFCTGGIRCAKAAAWMRGQGYTDVRELDGGILAYLETASPEASRWEGECFVFDERVSLVEGLRRGEAEVCHGCRRPLGAEDRTLPGYEAGVSCARCRDAVGPAELERRRERRRQVHLAEARGAVHLAPQRGGGADSEVGEGPEP